MNKIVLYLFFLLRTLINENKCVEKPALMSYERAYYYPCFYPLYFSRIQRHCLSLEFSLIDLIAQFMSPKLLNWHWSVCSNFKCGLTKVSTK